MNEQELKIAYDSGFVAPFVEMGLISENFEKTAEEKGRAIDTLETVISMASDGKLLKTAFEYGEMQALKDLGIISQKESASMQKTACETELRSSVHVVEGIRNFLVKSAASKQEESWYRTPAAVGGLAGGAGLGAGAYLANSPYPQQALEGLQNVAQQAQQYAQPAIQGLQGMAQQAQQYAQPALEGLRGLPDTLSSGASQAGSYLSDAAADALTKLKGIPDMFKEPSTMERISDFARDAGGRISDYAGDLSDYASDLIP